MAKIYELGVRRCAIDSELTRKTIKYNRQREPPSPATGCRRETTHSPSFALAKCTEQ